MLDNQWVRFQKEPGDEVRRYKLDFEASALRALPIRELVSETIEKMVEDSKFDPYTEVMLIAVEPVTIFGRVRVEAQIRPHHQEL